MSEIVLSCGSKSTYFIRHYGTFLPPIFVQQLRKSPFWKELVEGRVRIPRPDEEVFEDAPPAEEDNAGDDSSVPLEAVIVSAITGQTMDGVIERNGGGLTLGGSAEEDKEEPSIQVVRKAASNKELPTSVISEDVTNKCVEPCGTEVGSHDGNSGG